MQDERLLNIAPYLAGREGFGALIKSFKDGHVIVGSASSLKGVERLVNDEPKPTVAFVQDFLDFEETKAIVSRLKQLFPGIVVATIGTDQQIENADRQFSSSEGLHDIANFLLNLKR